MAKITKPKRPRLAGRYPDMGGFAELFRDQRVHVDIGIVHAPDGGSHWHLSDDGHDVLVEVETVQGRNDLTCRLASSAGGVGRGLWRVPAVGEEVVVIVPGGEAGFMPCIVATLSSGSPPARVSDERTILVATDAIEITAPRTAIGDAPENASSPIPLGDVLVAFENRILAALAAHVHPVVGVSLGGSTLPTGPSPELVTLQATESASLSDQLSDVAFTQKGG